MSSLSKFTTAFVDPGDVNPWRDLWIRVTSLGPWAQYPKVYKYEQAYCAYCGAWAPEHEPDCPYVLAGLLEDVDEASTLAPD